MQTTFPKPNLSNNQTTQPPQPTLQNNSDKMEAGLADAMDGLDVSAGVEGERAEGNGSNTSGEPLSISQQPMKKKKKKKSKPKNVRSPLTTSGRWNID